MANKKLIPKDRNIFRKFRQGVFYEDLYEEYHITEEDLIYIISHNVKGRYDYKRILSGGIEAQKQFIFHLNSRWNPLEPDAPYKQVSPYINQKKKIEVKEEEK